MQSLPERAHLINSKKSRIKKNTRKYLSNATVRSQSQKGKVFEFEEKPFEDELPIRNGPIKDIPVEIKINHKPKNKQ